MIFMKKLLPIILAIIATVLPAAAQLNGNGYYRVQNYATERYVYITDDKGKIDANTTSVDAMAIQLWKDFDKASSDASTVLYIESKGGNEYDVTSQGTGINKMINHNLKLRANSDGTYYAYGQQDGMAKYLGDANSSNAPEGTMSSEATGDRRKWWIKPITTAENFFGIKPNLAVGGKFYQPMYASFPMSPASSGVKIHVVTTYGYGMAVTKVVEGTIPAATPCFIECGSATAADNKMNVGGTGAAVGSNQMSGVYFENYMKTHLNLTPYDPNTMRVLGVLSDGSLGFVTATFENLPANQSYLRVPAGSPAEIRIVSQEEYDRVVASHPKSVTVAPAETKMYVGTELQLTATIAPENASDKRLTWKSSNTDVVTVDANGKIKAVGKGSAVVEATTINGLTAKCAVTVNPAYPEAIAIDPAAHKFYVGDQFQLTAKLTPEDVQHTEVTWKTSDASVVTVDNTGKIAAVKVGTATVTATTADGKAATAAITVNPVYPTAITLNSTERYITSKTSYQLVATLTPADVKDATINWSSANSSIATVDNTGKVTGNAIGSTVITATSPGGAQAACTVHITAQMPESVTMNFERLVMEVEDYRYLTAAIEPAGAYSALTWASSATDVVEVSSIGKVTAVGTGAATVTATTSNGLVAKCEITVLPKGVPATSVKVLPASVKLNPGEETTLAVEILPENVTNKFVTWTSNNSKIATVDANGKITAVANGSCVITAQCGSAKGNCVVTVMAVPVSEIILDRNQIEMEEGSQVTINATVLPENAFDKRIKWSSDNQAVATVDENGNVSVLTVGFANIIAEAMDGSGVRAVCALTSTSDLISVSDDANKPLTVYRLDGTLIFKAATREELSSLAPGLYIINNRKVMVK